jgi:transporter family-2 protein
MTKLIFMLLAVLGGLAGGLQAPINGALGKKIGSFEGAFVSFFLGTLLLTLVFLFLGKGNVLQAFNVPKWQLLGGFLGAILVTSIIIAVPKIGVASAIFAVIIGQILMSLIIDHFGFFGVKRIPFDWYRVLGMALMVGGLLFIFRGNVAP